LTSALASSTAYCKATATRDLLQLWRLDLTLLRAGTVIVAHSCSRLITVGGDFLCHRIEGDLDATECTVFLDCRLRTRRFNSGALNPPPDGDGSTNRSRSARSSSTSRYDSEKRRYQPTARRITSGSNCHHLKRLATGGARSSGPPAAPAPLRSTLASLRKPCAGAAWRPPGSGPCPRRASSSTAGWTGSANCSWRKPNGAAPAGRAYFEHLVAALLLAVVLQIDPRLPEAGDAGAQLRRIQQAVALMEANFASKLSAWSSWRPRRA
jgi:hypothetical protein